MRFSGMLILRPHPTIVDGKIYEPKLDCHICGKPGTWRAQYFGSFEVLGWVLCDGCTNPHFRDLDEIKKGGKR